MTPSALRAIERSALPVRSAMSAEDSPSRAALVSSLVTSSDVLTAHWLPRTAVPAASPAARNTPRISRASLLICRCSTSELRSTEREPARATSCPVLSSATSTPKYRQVNESAHRLLPDGTASRTPTVRIRTGHYPVQRPVDLPTPGDGAQCGRFAGLVLL
ncbi:Uncharacterised protein [Mycobacteroides abscessus subsp. abscessus]|nr:Uncharacterised protein [Mycobacteroides abscessus subsp. abscessus]